MRYMTKEWYETMQRTSFHLLLKTSKRAETYSEDYYERLYKREEDCWLKQQEAVANVKFEDIYPDDFQAEYVDGRALEPVEFEQAKEAYFMLRDNARLDYENRPAFNAEQEKVNFRVAVQHNIKHLKKNLPMGILQKIADIRVFALNFAAADVKKEIAAYCKANQKVVKIAENAYWKEYRRNFKKGEPIFAEDFNFHDCKVISCRKKGKDMVLCLDNSGGFTHIKQLIFKDCSILKRDKPLNGAWWLNDEIYKTNKGYEIHILLQKTEPIDFIVSVTDIKYVFEEQT